MVVDFMNVVIMMQRLTG